MAHRNRGCSYLWSKSFGGGRSSSTLQGGESRLGCGLGCGLGTTSPATLQFEGLDYPST